jgi:oxalate decarboxylase
MLVPPATDQGTLPNLRFSFSDAHMRLTTGGWTRQVTGRELGISTTIAGVDMRLNSGSVRELHWHKAAEWAYMLYGTARITAVDPSGHNFVDDVGVGDLWYFQGGTPHSIQGLNPDGCEFLLVFDDGNFDEDNTFLISDWFKHVPNDVLAKNFGAPASAFGHTPDPSELYIFPAPVPGPLASDKIAGATPVTQSFSHKMMAQEQKRDRTDHRFQYFPGLNHNRGGSGRGRARRHARTALASQRRRMEYYIQGQARMGVFGASGQARTFDYQAGDVGYVHFAMGHYIEHTGGTTLRFLEMFKSSYYADVSLDQWMALTPPELVEAHLKLGPEVMDVHRKKKVPVVPA